MPGLLTECQECFGTKDLYVALEISKKSTEKQVQKAYRRLSLKVHPDRVSAEDEKEEATRKFQVLGKIYTILSDSEKRAIYDESGDVDDDDMSLDRDWADYWRQLFVPVTLRDIKDFEKAYKGSPEELEHVKTAYETHEGDMDGIIDDVLCAGVEDEARFRKILKELVSNKELPDYDAFSSEGKGKRAERVKKATLEKAEAEGMSKELGLGPDSSEDSFSLMIRKRTAQRQAAEGEFMDRLQKKYAMKEEKTKSKAKNKKGK